MIETVIFALMGGSLLAAALLDSADADPASDAETADETPAADAAAPEGTTLVFDGSDTLHGTEGADTLPASQPDGLSPDVVALAGGDDIATLTSPDGVEVRGEAGADQLSSLAPGNRLDGGAGDDTLSGVDTTDMIGGDGNDLILFDSDTELNATTALLDGGDGADTIQIRADGGLDLPDRGGASVTGGAGADQFEVILDLENSTEDLTGDDGLLQSQIAQITDFTVGEDLLRIEVQRDVATAGRAASLSVTHTTLTDAVRSEIVVAFAATTDATAAQAVLTVEGPQALQLSDILVVGV